MVHWQRLLTFVVLVFASLTLSCLVKTGDPYRPNDEVALADANEPIVYVGNYGNTYHRKDCILIRLDRYPMTLSEAKRFYKPCKQCKPVE
jgi:hypothetical protein